jgi:hypothetical protein
MVLMKRLTKFAQSAGNLVTMPGPGTRRALLLGPLRKFAKPTPFKPTAASLKVYQALIPEKVALIDRLPSKYRKEAQEVVWKAVMNGYDSAGLARELQDRFGILPERAELVATSQCKMARSVIENAQQIELGITEAVWRHDKERCAIQSHRAFDGKRYALTRGVSMEGKRVWPSSEPQCFCGSSAINAPEEKL